MRLAHIADSARLLVMLLRPVATRILTGSGGALAVPGQGEDVAPGGEQPGVIVLPGGPVAPVTRREPGLR